MSSYRRQNTNIIAKNYLHVVYLAQKQFRDEVYGTAKGVLGQGGLDFP